MPMLLIGDHSGSQPTVEVLISVSTVSKQVIRLKQYKRLLQLVSGEKFVDGILQERNAA